MNKKNNVNPDHYKTAGRERPGQDIVQEIQKQNYTEAKAEEEGREHGTGSKFIPGRAQATVLPPAAETDHEPAGEPADQNSKS